MYIFDDNTLTNNNQNLDNTEEHSLEKHAMINKYNKELLYIKQHLDTFFEMNNKDIYYVSMVDNPSYNHISMKDCDHVNPDIRERFEQEMLWMEKELGRFRVVKS